jgi:hypothetical protein
LAVYKPQTCTVGNSNNRPDKPVVSSSRAKYFCRCKTKKGPSRDGPFGARRQKIAAALPLGVLAYPPESGRTLTSATPTRFEAVGSLAPTSLLPLAE